MLTNFFLKNAILSHHFVLRTNPKAQKKIDSLRLELKDVEGQLKSCAPIITFLNNKIRLNDVYAGDRLEYEKVGARRLNKVTEF